jgi:hypothetical protein
MCCKIKGYKRQQEYHNQVAEEKGFQGEDEKSE